jgi:iron complex transport system substrate-binding protein
MLTRRATLALGAALGLAPSACERAPVAKGDVVAAGQPAALLIWAVGRERLAGWPRKPDAERLAGLAPGAAALPELGGLAGPGRQAGLEAIAALHPRMIIDYGDTDPRNVELGERVQARLNIPWTLIDGALTRIPEAFRQAGGLLGERARGDSLADEAEAVLARWRKAPAGGSFYYARGADGLETGFRGALATEVLEGAGWSNVAVGETDIGRVTHEQVIAWDPEILVTLDEGFARTALHSELWRRRPNGNLRRILLLPDRPFGWIDRPPSVNRLLGCAWLAAPNDGIMGTAMLNRRLYGLGPAEIRRPQWLA